LQLLQLQSREGLDLLFPVLPITHGSLSCRLSSRLPGPLSSNRFHGSHETFPVALSRVSCKQCDIPVLHVFPVQYPNATAVYQYRIYGILFTVLMLASKSSAKRLYPLPIIRNILVFESCLSSDFTDKSLTGFLGIDAACSDCSMDLLAVYQNGMQCVCVEPSIAHY